MIEFFNNKRGASLYIALIIMAVLMSMAFGLASILTNQIKTVRDIGYSVTAFYAAETGIERYLGGGDCDSGCSEDLTLGGGQTAHYDVSIINYSTGDCQSGSCVVSVGNFNNTKRAIQIEGGGGSFGGTFACGDDIDFNSITYGTVLSATGKCWLDRNLGALRVANNYYDSQAYGDYYQWGRMADGHQLPTSDITTDQADDPDTSGNNEFILTDSAPNNWLSYQDDSLWQGGVNNPCPPGWRLATHDEWKAEAATWSSQDYYGAFASPLKLPAAGARHHLTGGGGEILETSETGYYWSNSTSGVSAYDAEITSNGADVEYTNFDHTDWRGEGVPVRCIED
jgi:uncharacterized protein (TIGR02145 family)